MDIKHEKVKNLENEITNKITYYLMDNKKRFDLEKGKEIFMEIYDGEDALFKEQGFLMWLIWNYKSDNSNSIIEQYRTDENKNLSDSERIILTSLIDGFFSVYKINKIGNQLILKDIFSDIEFITEDTFNSNEINNNDLLIGRIYSFQNKNYIYDEYTIIDKSFKNMIVKNIYEKFETHKSKGYSYEIKDFIQNNSLVVLKMGVIINQLLSEQSNNNNYKVWQNTYVYIEKNLILEKLQKRNFIEKDYDEDGITYLRLFDLKNEKILAEIVMSENKMELECNSEEEANKSKLIIEELAGGDIKHLKDEVLNLDDLL